MGGGNLDDRTKAEFLDYVDRESTPELAAAFRLGTFEDLGVIAMYGPGPEFAVALSHEKRTRRVGYWRNVPFQLAAVNSSGPYLRSTDLFSKHHLERLGVCTLGLTTEQIKALSSRGVGCWFLLSPLFKNALSRGSHMGTGFALGIYGDEPGEIEWLTTPAKRNAWEE